MPPLSVIVEIINGIVSLVGVIKEIIALTHKNKPQPERAQFLADLKGALKTYRKTGNKSPLDDIYSTLENKIT